VLVLKGFFIILRKLKILINEAFGRMKVLLRQNNQVFEKFFLTKGHGSG
jgi:hypothetical protein